MTGPELAKVLVDRLNELIADPEIRTAVRELIGTRVEFSGDVARALAVHPTIQVGAPPGFNPADSDDVADLRSVDLGPVGLLNGICGADGHGTGYLAYRVDTGPDGELGQLIEFVVLEPRP